MYEKLASGQGHSSFRLILGRSCLVSFTTTAAGAFSTCVNVAMLGLGVIVVVFLGDETYCESQDSETTG